MTWNHRTLERLRMDHPNASMTDLVLMLSDEAIKDAYSALRVVHARAANMPSDTKEQRVRMATSRKEKLIIQQGRKAPIESGALRSRSPLSSSYRRPTAPTERARHEEIIRKRLDTLRAGGIKTMSQVNSHYAAQGLKPVKCIDDKGVPYIKYVKE